MRRTSAWIGWALCLCASLSASAQIYPEDDDPILEVNREDSTVPEPATEPAAEFLRCNKVRRRTEAHLSPGRDLRMFQLSLSSRQVFISSLYKFHSH